jgi:hypothetical protein
VTIRGSEYATVGLTRTRAVADPGPASHVLVAAEQMQTCLAVAALIDAGALVDAPARKRITPSKKISVAL